MTKKSIGRIIAFIFFFALLTGAVFCTQRLAEDIHAGKYFSAAGEFRYDLVFVIAYILIIFFVLRYGYYLAINRVSWENIKDDYIYLLNRKYFSHGQWALNVLLFWLSLAGFVHSLAISAMKGHF